MSKKSSRTKMVYLNTMVVMATYLMQILFGFGIRKLFIATLGIKYLGYNSVFTNILSMLNMADLGIGVAITSFLYKPLAEGDKERICTLMHIYKKLYQMLGIFVLGIGIIISFFLQILIPDATCGIGYLRLLFYINLAGTASTYFLAYKRTLLIADEKTYETSIVDTIIFFFVSICQVIILLFFKSYVLYLIVTVLKNIVSNFILSVQCDRQYNFLQEEINRDMVEEYRQPIIQYVKDVFVSKIGAYIFYSTDNIIISVFRGSLLAGCLSNYTLITVQVQSLVTAVLASIQATLGQFINTEKSQERKKHIINCYLFTDFMIGNFCFLCIAFLSGPFVALLFGQEYELGQSTSMWLGINLMLTIMIQLPSQLFVIYKLYHYDRWIIAISATLNILISAGLVQVIGIDGVLIGTFVTSLIYLFSRMYVICHVIFHISVVKDYFTLLYYFAVSFVSTIAIQILCTFLPEVSTIYTFAIRMVCVGISALIVPVMMTFRKKEFGFLVDKFIKKLLPIHRGDSI